MNFSRKVLVRSLQLVLILTLLGSCGQQASRSNEALSSLSKEIMEIRPGILKGYLEEEDLPNSLQLLPPPPEEGSSAWQLDMEMAEMYLAMEDEARKAQAIVDAELHFPEALEAFNPVLEITLSEEKTPLVHMILRRTLADAGLSTYAAKDHYNRERPFMVNGMPTCTPEEEEYLSQDGSYPSGHTAIGWTWALILTELFPGQTDPLSR